MGNNLIPAINQAIVNAEGIHFNLEGIRGDPVTFANTYGPTKYYITAYELHVIKTQGHCQKTKFYQKGSVDVTEDPSAKLHICGQ